MSTSLRFLSHMQIVGLGGTDPKRGLDDVLETVRLMHKGDASMPAETHVDLGTPMGKVYALPARVGGRLNATGVKWTAHRPKAEDGYPQAIAMTLLNRADNGLPIGLLESGSLTATRTAAVSAVALKYATPRRVKRVLLLGAGVQASAHLTMLKVQFPDLEQLYCWNRTPAHLSRMLSEAGTLPWPVSRLATLEEATVQPWDALITCTSASEPFIGPDMLRPGTQVLQIGYHEVSFDAIRNADKVVVDGWGEYCKTSAKSLFQMYRAGQFSENEVAADLSGLVLDGWRPAPKDKVYFSSFGLNVFDIALAARVLHDAVVQGVGTLMPLDMEAKNNC